MLMKTVKKNNKANFAVTSKTKVIDPPAGFHWMEEGGRYYLMEGDYKPHPGAVARPSSRWQLTRNEGIQEGRKVKELWQEGCLLPQGES